MGFKCDCKQRYTVCTSPTRRWCYMFSVSIAGDQHVHFQFTTFDLILIYFKKTLTLVMALNRN
jgi:hypothetical protein